MLECRQAHIPAAQADPTRRNKCGSICVRPLWEDLEIAPSLQWEIRHKVRRRVMGTRYRKQKPTQPALHRPEVRNATPGSASSFPQMERVRVRFWQALPIAV